MIAAIVQARMGSTRLPGKVMKEVMGRPLLSYLIERIRSCSIVEKTIIATTINKEDDAIVLLAERESIPVYRGSQDDVLDRYYQTAKKYQFDNVIRITADCPLVDPTICNKVIEVYLNSDVDFVHTALDFPEGVDCEIFSFPALERSWKEARKKSEREHLTLYMHHHPEIFKKTTLHNNINQSRYRFTVDESEDFEVVKRIIEALYIEREEPFGADKIIEYLDLHPEVFMINQDVVRNVGLIKSLKEEE